MIRVQRLLGLFHKNGGHFSMTREILPVRRDGEPEFAESYSGDTRRSMYRRVYPRLTFGACARHFMYHFGRGGPVTVSRPPLLTAPRTFSRRTTGVFMGLLYDRFHPLGRSYTRTRQIRARRRMIQYVCARV